MHVSHSVQLYNGHGGHGRGVSFFKEMIKQHTTLRRIPSPNGSDSRRLGLVSSAKEIHLNKSSVGRLSESQFGRQVSDSNCINTNNKSEIYQTKWFFRSLFVKIGGNHLKSLCLWKQEFLNSFLDWNFSSMTGCWIALWGLGFGVRRRRMLNLINNLRGRERWSIVWLIQQETISVNPHLTKNVFCQRI